MAKKKEQKKKERERRVAQKKLAAQKRAHEQNAQEPAKSNRKADLFTAPVTDAKPTHVPTNVPKPFNYRRTGG